MSGLVTDESLPKGPYIFAPTSGIFAEGNSNRIVARFHKVKSCDVLYFKNKIQWPRGIRPDFHHVAYSRRCPESFERDHSRKGQLNLKTWEKNALVDRDRICNTFATIHMYTFISNLHWHCFVTSFPSVKNRALHPQLTH